jgi:ligand-binding sensor domain-containing protein
MNIRLILLTAILVSVLTFPSHADEWSYMLKGNYINDFVISGNYAWCATLGSAVRWDLLDGSCKQYSIRDGLPSNYLNCVTVDDKGHPWFSSSSISFFNGSVWKTIDISKYFLSNQPITVLFTDHLGSVWTGSYGGGVVRFEGETGKAFPAGDSLSNARDIVCDKDGVQWFAASNGVWSMDGDHWKQYTTKDGLPSNDIRCAAVEPGGARWFGTSQGGVRFDGASWKIISSQEGLVHGSVRSIAIDHKGVVWFGTDGGVTSYDIGGKMTSYTSENELLSNRVTGITVDGKNKIWICYRYDRKGISQFDGSEWKHIATANSGLPSDKVNDIRCGPDGILWFALDIGAASYDGTSWKLYSSQNGLVTDSIARILIDSGNRKWFQYTEPTGITRFDGKVWSTFTEKDGLKSPVIRAAGEGKDGSIWVSTMLGITRYDGNSWRDYHQKERLISPYITSIAEDGKGVLWFGTENGLSRFDGISWRSFTVDDGLLYNNIRLVRTGPDGTVWFIDDRGGLTSFDGTRFRSHPIPAIPGQPTRIGAFVIDQNGMVWTNVYRYYSYLYGNILKEGLWLLDGEAWRVFPLKLGAMTNPDFSKVEMDSENRKWFRLRGKLICYDGLKSAEYKVNCPDTFVGNDVEVDKSNTIWISSAISEGVSFASSFDGNRWTTYGTEDAYTLECLEIETDSRNLKWFMSSDLITYDGVEWKIALSRDKIPINGLWLFFKIDKKDVKWFGSNDSGVWKWDGKVWTYYTEKDGLASNHIYGMAVDHNNTLWVVTEKGLSWFDGSTWKTYSNDNNPLFGIAVDNSNVKWISSANGLIRYDGITWKIFTEKDGLARNYVGAISVDTKNILWLGTSKGVTSFDGNAWKTYTISNGLMDNWVQQIIVDKNNRKWFFSNDSISILDDSKPLSVSTPTPTPLFKLSTYPNPFNASTVIEFDLSHPGIVNLFIYDIGGRKIRVLAIGLKPAGKHSMVWDGKDNGGLCVASGVYFCRLMIQGREVVRRLMILR